MKFLSVPLPSWKSFLKVFVPGKLPDSSFSRQWQKESENSIWFSKSAWSLAGIAIWKKIISGKKQISFWFPGYFCNSSLFLLRSLGVKIVFYPIKEDREPDYSACKDLLQEHEIDFFVLVHYFGKPSNATRAYEFCVNKKAILVEDCAHVLTPSKGMGEKGDFILYSPHKHLPIPEGSALIIRNSGPSKIIWKEDYTSLIIKAVKEHYVTFKNTKFYLFKWYLKRLAQKAGFRTRKMVIPDFLEDESMDSVIYPLMTNFSRKLLVSILSKLGEIARRKLRIQRVWDSVVSENITFQKKREEDWVPYLTEYSFSSSIEAKTHFEHLFSQGLPVSNWPDLPPEVRVHSDFFKTSIQLRENSIFLPTHPSLSEKEISLSNIPRDFSSYLSVDSQELNEFSWNEELNSLGSVNLLQTWFFGETKNKIEGWETNRFLLKTNDKKIGLVQVLSKTYFYFIKILRINRGPLFFENANEKEKRSVLNFLSKLSSFGKFSILFFNPELPGTGENITSMFRIGFNNRKVVPWASSYVNLSLTAEELRMHLDSKWRNMLNAAEKTEIQLEVSETMESFHWMLERYSELMVKKDFIGIPISFLKGLKDSSTNSQKLVVLNALYQGERVACICLSMANQTGMYLVGWNGEEGRRLKANQYLLWNAIVYLKSQGYRYFDLGGIDEENTPKVAEFKIGVNGERYELAGEFVRF